MKPIPYYFLMRGLSRTIRVIMMITLACLVIPAQVQQVRAEGSSAITQGNRAYIEWHSNATSAGIPRQTTISAYAHAGEQIFVGSSAMGIGSGDVLFFGPDGTTTGSCNAQGGGLIADIDEENAGPLPATDGFTPCIISAAQTTAAGDGIWSFNFISPNPNSDIGQNPTSLAYNAVWTQDTTHHWINAWHISVHDGAGAAIGGRVFATYLAYNMGKNGVGLDTEYWIITNDGYGYTVDMNGIDPWGFIFFANAEGVINARGNSTYRSFQMVGTPPSVSLPTGYSIYNPRLADDASQGNITHKIFFQEPDKTLPISAKSYSGTTWLLPKTVAPPAPQDFVFTGAEGTPNQAGTAPLGGYFTFDVTGNANYQISIDVDRNGIYNDPIDRVLVGRASAGMNTVYWDALDGYGDPVPAGSQTYDATIQINVGEVHFPFVDAENNAQGIKLLRFRGGETATDKDLIYYNDNFTYTGTNAYDYSLCAQTDTPVPPNGSYPQGGANKNALCYGVPSALRAALLGVHSAAGAHAWSSYFGDNRVVDTWTYFPSLPVHLYDALILAESKLSITKTHAPATLVPGQAVTYTIKVTNAGVSPAAGAKVADSVPEAILNVLWSCAITTGTGTCNDVSGTGNVINTTLDLAAGAVATYTVHGILNPTASGSLINVASVRRPNDNTDPDLSDNSVSDGASIRPAADLELNKTLSTTPPILANSLVTFVITLRNRGPVAATNVEVSEKLPAGLTFEEASSTMGNYDSATGLWSISRIAPDAVAALTLTALWNGVPVTNTAQVSKSDQFDPDSTPGNSDPTEDDQSSVALPVQIADLELSKRVDAAQVNVGSNVTFTMNLTNLGPDTATNVRVSEKLPTGLSLVKATSSQGTYNTASGEWSVGNLALKATASLKIEVTVLGVGPFTNSAQVSASDQYDPDSTPNNDMPKEDDQGMATVGGKMADLSLSKGVDNAQPPFNGTITYTLTLQNAGPSAATGVAVSDKLPDGLSFMSYVASQGTYDSASGAWSIGTVQADKKATLTISAKVVSSSLIRNTAQVSASDQPDPDSTPGNSAPGEDDQASIALIPQLADLELDKVADVETANVGSAVAFTITVTNAGPSMATGVEVSEHLPAGLQYVSHVASQGNYNPVTGVWQIGTITFEQVVTLTLRAQITGVGPYTNVAEVSKSNQPDPDSTPGNGVVDEDDRGTATIGGMMADLSLIKRVDTPTLPADGIVTYTIWVRNNGPSDATDVQVGEQLPTEATVLGTTVSQGTYFTGDAVWDVGDLAIGEVANLSLRVQFTGTGPFLNVAEVIHSDQFDPDSTPGNNVSTEDDQSSATVGLGLAPSEADLELTKSAVTLGKLRNSAYFIITVVNQGQDTATNVEVSEQLPAGLSFVSAAPSQGSYDHTTGAWTIGTIPKGAAAMLNILTLVTTDEEITNTAQVSRSDQIDPDSTPGNNVVTEDDQDSVSFSRLTAVTLAGFSARWQTKGVLVSWATGSELNCLGFQIYRSASGRRADATLITPQSIVAYGSAISGASYSFLDTDADSGVGYTYWLVEHATSGASSEFGPVSPASLSGSTTVVFLPIIQR
ncbi:MAG: DUF11 domain-containing protein [Oscillochloris sp.]|nr:DUF11 domain-containing protein [Oscillochloris sp.]